MSTGGACPGTTSITIITCKPNGENFNRACKTTESRNAEAITAKYCIV